ncbi:MAG: glycoside hydrolase family 3 C-terminal domain-containing protein [Spirochaetales bacterium]|nr:glycoside hydrolase family 3 C-terminal domain-containing protein [Spirochaetales bacterium]
MKFQDMTLPVSERVEDLMDRLTVAEKVSQLVHRSRGIERLGIPEYNWWSEGLHGVSRAGISTVFPQGIALAASFHIDLFRKVVKAIADEARAKYHEFVRRGDRGIYKGITLWSPNVNIFRDPRWGRGQETYGEDPYWTSRLGVAFCRELQDEDGPSPYLKVMATPKHFAVHSGPEEGRHSFNSTVGKKDLFETYLPAFRACVIEGKAVSVMGAYNRINGEAACGSPTLLQTILRDDWGFEGFVVSDCGAIEDIFRHHKLAETAGEAAALALKAGCDLNCGKIYDHLIGAFESGMISEEDLDISLRRVLTARFRAGMLDPDETVPYSAISYDAVDSPGHRKLSREMASRAMVLLKNRDSILPLDRNNIKNIAVIGPNADSLDVLLANYHGTPSCHTTVVEGIRHAVNENTRVYYHPGCDLTSLEENFWGEHSRMHFTEACLLAEKSDVVVMALGLSPHIEGEEGDAANSDGGGDRKNLSLPGRQEELLKAVAATGTPVILAVLNGSPLDLGWAQENVDAIIEAWYPGQEGGNALADILFGKVNPSGRLPVTFPASAGDLPHFHDYSMKGRTYRYAEAEPLYPFGYGLSYTDFSYGNLVVEDLLEISGIIRVAAFVKNTGHRTGREVVQLYFRAESEEGGDGPVHQLAGVRNISLDPADEVSVEFHLTREDLGYYTERGDLEIGPAKYTFFLGGQQPGSRSAELTGRGILQADFYYNGEREVLREAPELNWNKKDGEHV